VTLSRSADDPVNNSLFFCYRICSGVLVSDRIVFQSRVQNSKLREGLKKEADKFISESEDGSGSHKKGKESKRAEETRNHNPSTA
jgi:hypothetical protein